MPKTQTTGEIVLRARRKRGMTLDQYARRLEITGPGVWKYEKGHAYPSFGLWRKIAEDAGLEDKRATLIWIRNKAPERLKHYADELLPGTKRPGRRKKGRIDYSTFENASEIREAVRRDKTLPKNFRDVLGSDEIWEGFRPVGNEINLVRDLFAPLGKASKSAYTEALWLVREFCHSF